MKFLRNFKNINKNNVILAGGKGSSLGEMTKAGISVPSGFVILSIAFEKFLEETDLNVEIDSILHSVNHKEIHTVDNASEKIKALIARAEMPKNIATEIQKFFKKLNSKYVAVRSSATAEDSASAAWAGQLESYLNTTEENLLENVKRCWASLFTPRAIFYRFEKDLHKQKISVAVVVQKMVESGKSGITFSVHPVTQNKNQLIIEAGFGLGEAIVLGQITPDSYVVEKQPRRIIDKNVQIQTKGLYRAESGGSEWRDIPKEQGEKQVLSDKEILELSEIILHIEEHYGFPCDIEWAFENGKFYIVQSRSITTLQDESIVEHDSAFNIKSANFVLNYQAKGDFNLIIFDFFRNNEKRIDLMSFVYGRQLDHFVTQKFKESPLECCWEVMFKELLEICASDKKFLGFETRIPILEAEFKTAAQELSKKPGNKFLFQKFLDALMQVGRYYIMLDFDIFPNEEQLISEKYPRAYKNFKKIGQVKNEAKKILINPLLLGKGNLFEQTLKSIGKHFSIKNDDILYYKIDEIKQLYKRRGKLSQEEIRERKEAFLILTYKNRVHYFFGEEAKKRMNEFYSLQKESGVPNLRGNVAFRGKEKVIGKAVIFSLDFSNIEKDVKDFIKKISKKSEPIILVSDVTTPEMLPIFKKVSAMVTAHGGLNTHAAINAREMKIPTIVGVKGVLSVIKDGDLIEVDTRLGIVNKLTT